MQEPATNQTFKYPTGSEAKGAITVMMKCSSSKHVMLECSCGTPLVQLSNVKTCVMQSSLVRGSCELIQDWRGGKVDKVTHGYG